MSATAPIRLDKDLLADAATEAQRQKRTAPKQIEYWAELGQTLEGVLTREDLIQLREGLLRLEPVNAAPVSADDVFANLENARRKGSLQQQVTQARAIYQASESHPGYLEKIQANGQILIGRFENGKFHAHKP